MIDNSSNHSRTAQKAPSDAAFQPLPVEDFRNLGLDHIAYVRQVIDDSGHDRFAIHAADGTELVVIDGRDMALGTIRQHELEPVSLH